MEDFFRSSSERLRCLSVERRRERSSSSREFLAAPRFRWLDRLLSSLVSASLALPTPELFDLPLCLSRPCSISLSKILAAETGATDGLFSFNRMDDRLGSPIAVSSVTVLCPGTCSLPYAFAAFFCFAFRFSKFCLNDSTFSSSSFVSVSSSSSKLKPYDCNAFVANSSKFFSCIFVSCSTKAVTGHALDAAVLAVDVSTDSRLRFPLDDELDDVSLSLLDELLSLDEDELLSSSLDEDDDDESLDVVDDEEEDEDRFRFGTVNFSRDFLIDSSPLSVLDLSIFDADSLANSSARILVDGDLSFDCEFIRTSAGV